MLENGGDIQIRQTNSISPNNQRLNSTGGGMSNYQAMKTFSSNFS
jgi:hypothetical protein